MDGEEIKAVLGKNIKNIRSSRRYSQAELAERADISIIYLSNIERGVKYPKPAILSQIAEGLNVEVYELFKTNHIPKTVPIAPHKETKIKINLLSQDIIKQVNQTMERVTKKYLK